MLAEVDALIAPFVVGNTHPRFFGWAHGAGTPVGVVAELIAAALNANCGGRDHIGPIVERQIAGWAAEAFGFPAESSGVFVTGASQANFLGLLVARDAALGHAVRAEGLKAERAADSPTPRPRRTAACARRWSSAASVRAFCAQIETDAAGAMRTDRLRMAHRTRPRGGAAAIPDRRHRRAGSTSARSTNWRRWPTSPPPSGSGCTSTARSAR